MTAQELTLLAIKLLFSVLAVVLVVVYLIRPILQALRNRPELPEMTLSEVLPEEMEEEIQIPAGGVKPDIPSMLEEARGDPQRTAVFVSRWLREKK